jgi:hypothetical protein
MTHLHNDVFLSLMPYPPIDEGEYPQTEGAPF